MAHPNQHGALGSRGALNANRVRLKNGFTLGEWKMARATLRRLQRAQRHGREVFSQLVRAEAHFANVDA